MLKKTAKSKNFFLISPVEQLKLDFLKTNHQLNYNNNINIDCNEISDTQLIHNKWKKIFKNTYYNTLIHIKNNKYFWE